MTLFDRYDEWLTERSRLNDLENGETPGGPPPAGEWHASDDDAVDRMHEAMDALVICRQALVALGEALMLTAYGGGGLTCEETELLVAAYNVILKSEIGESIMEAHVLTDTDDTDQHHDAYLKATKDKTP